MGLNCNSLLMGGAKSLSRSHISSKVRIVVATFAIDRGVWLGVFQHFVTPWAFRAFSLVWCCIAWAYFEYAHRCAMRVARETNIDETETWHNSSEWDVHLSEWDMHACVWARYFPKKVINWFLKLSMKFDNIPEFYKLPNLAISTYIMILT